MCQILSIGPASVFQTKRYIRYMRLRYLLDSSETHHPSRAESRVDLRGLRLCRDQRNGQEHEQDADRLDADDAFAQHQH